MGGAEDKGANPKDHNLSMGYVRGSRHCEYLPFTPTDRSRSTLSRLSIRKWLSVDFIIRFPAWFGGEIQTGFVFVFVFFNVAQAGLELIICLLLLLTAVIMPLLPHLLPN